MTEQLLDVFNARRGIVCCVGAGGKKTTMFRLAAEHPGRVGITATAHIEFFPKTLAGTKYIAPEADLLERIKADRSSKTIAFAQPSERRGRRAGMSLPLINEFKIQGRFDLLLIKADGARSRWIKAPAEHEPPVPDCVDTVIAVVSAKAFGKRLTDKIAHRVDKITTVAGVGENERIQPHHIARLFASEEGALKNTGTAKIVPLINMVDDTECEKLARQAASAALSETNRFKYVVLATMQDEHPVIDIVYA